ncbi:helix-turn-helix transcriptional regulator [Kiloniella majae]|uniref:helix-turn-helix transcriptional regulator n=1 Tax=Kiloniella majae TaxID=1938558 RepID=UPI0015C51AAF|nr:autoinducer binding domain-containing protein [Kiloniella majae]
MEYAELVKIVIRLKQCQTPSELQECFSQAISVLGFQQFAYMRFARNNVDIQHSIYTFSEAWKIRYFQEGYDQVDPVFIKAFETGETFFWSACMSEFTKGVEHFFEEAAVYGIYAGLTTPLKSSSKAKAIMTIVAAKTEENKDLKEPDPSIAAMIRILSECFHQVAIQILAPDDLMLKLRQKQVLTLASYGMSSKEIAAALQKSEAYINELITGILHKLGTQSRPAAVRRALELGLLG